MVKLYNIAVYLITFLKPARKNRQTKIGMPKHNIFIHVLEGISIWCCQIIDYLKGYINKFKLNFQNALENKRELIWCNSNKTLFLQWGTLTLVNDLCFQIYFAENTLRFYIDPNQT